MRRFILIALVVFSVFACAGPENAVTPVPQEIARGSGYCRLDRATVEDDLAFQLPESYNLTSWQRDEAYRLSISRDGINCSAASLTGLFYGHQTLDMLRSYYGDRIPCMEITDWPQFEYRGVMLDVSRHFYDADFVIKQLELWSKLKINRFHWHLTDGTGWRLQIERYPELTEQCDGQFYTGEDVRRVLHVADSLHITVVPEIEMFGHSEEVQKVYPQLFCFGSQVKSSEYCIGREATFEFLENVLDEVIELFPSKYIHIGGDEASKEHWKKCPACQRRMKEEGLESEDELQSYGISRISRHVLCKGRCIIGWDEIMEGGLADGAVVMSWRGEEGGKQAAAMGHSVIMTPGQWCYINNCQDAPAYEPVSQGGYLPLKRVYSYNPAPGEFMMGLQANLWTEYVATPQHMEYMLYPRVFAIAEIGWSNPRSKEYADFRKRCLWLLDEIREKGYNCFDLEHEKGERDLSLAPKLHKACGCKVKYNTEYHPKYHAGGDSALCDGLYGSWEFGDRWQGFLCRDADVVIDLGKVCDIRSISADFGQWVTVEIWMPDGVRFAVSEDGLNYTELAYAANDVPADEKLPTFKAFCWKGKVSARYIRVVGEIRKSGRGGWIFCDEISVE